MAISRRIAISRQGVAGGYRKTEYNALVGIGRAAPLFGALQLLIV
jgi:hypothetical protein